MLRQMRQKLHRKARLACFFLVVAAMACAVEPVFAAERALDQPGKVVLSPNGGRFFVESRVQAVVKEGVSVITFVIPAEASGLQIEVPGQQTVHWTSTPVRQGADGGLAQSRQALLVEKEQLAGRMEAARARKDLWKHLPARDLGFEDMEKRDKSMPAIIASSTVEELKLGRELAELEQLLSLLPVNSAMSQRIAVTLQKPVADMEALPVRYSYTLRNCGWRPVYVFDAISRKDEIAVRLLAEIRQVTGMDWRNVQLVLASHEPSLREPGPLPPWEVGENAPAAPQRVLRMERHAQEAVQAEEMAELKRVPPVFPAPVQADTSGAYATWSLSVRWLPEGVSRLTMDEDTWKTPLQRLARPLRKDGRVWLTAEYTPQANKIWPAGNAEYNVDGQYVGQGFFRPQGDATSLFFGVDPRVSVITTADDKKRGETGLIAKNRTWSWSWVFTVHNEHEQPVNVRLERPEPIIVEQAVEVKYQNNPSPRKDEKNHALVWDVAVPAKGKSSVSHAVSITAPRDLLLSPVAP